jgi:hypothetical protein
MGIFDVTLRHVVQHHARELVQALVPAGASVEIVGWIDTQVTALERRLDKALDLRLNGEPRILCPEFQLDFDVEMAARVYEYQALLFMGLRAAGKPRPPPMETVVFLLRGRRKPWPARRELRRGWPESRWSGVRFRIEAIYQRTVEQLRARPGVFWLVFTPLATNATAAAIRGVIETIRQQVASRDERAELYAAILVLATIDPWGHNLRKEIEAMLDEIDKLLLREIPMLREAFEEGEAKGIEKMLRELFVRRMGRELSAAEQEALAKRAGALGPNKLLGAGVMLEGDALAAWLLDPAGC